MHVRKPSPGTAIALLALFFAMGGTAIAARHYLITSTKQIKPSVLKSLKGRAGPRGATGAAGATGTTGAAGAKGLTGNEGKQGPPGPTTLSKLEEVRGPFATTEFLFIFDVAISEAFCPAGSSAISGAGAVEEAKKSTFEASEAMVEEGRLIGWKVISFYPELVGGVEAVAYCAKEGNAVQASRLSPAAKRSRREANIKQAIERLHNQ
jgi:hypothetical protein